MRENAKLKCVITPLNLSLELSLFHGEEHVKKLFSTAVIVNEDTH